MAMKASFALILYTYCLVIGVSSLPNGAPMEACGGVTDIAPNHRPHNASNNDNVPYHVHLYDFEYNSYVPGKQYYLYLQSDNDTGYTFRGFMIQARTVADDFPAGYFANYSTNYQPQCSDETAATHTNNTDKNFTALIWISPPVGTGAIRFRYAFVMNYTTYWANLYTDPIEEADYISGGTTTGSGGSFNGSNETSMPTSISPEDISLPFLSFSNKLQELRSYLDGVSDAIYIPTGFPFGLQTHTTAYVGANGVISFSRPFYYWYPSLFPGYYYLRRFYVVAPYWADHDIRRDGNVFYETFERGRSRNDDVVLDTVSHFLRLNNEALSFSGTFMILAEWQDVHPYPHGSSYSYYFETINPSIGTFTNKENTYQALVITDGKDSYTVFTYMCDLIQWSGLWRYPTIGYNAAGTLFANHPLTGREEANQIDCISNSNQYTNVVYKISADSNLIQLLQAQCLSWYFSDIESYGNSENISTFSKSQVACPCTSHQAWWDRRFQYFTSKDDSFCFIQKFANARGGTQECCYSTSSQMFSALVLQGRSSGGLLRFHPWWSGNYPNYNNYDRSPQDICCFSNVGYCRYYHERRPPQNCDRYVTQRRTHGRGDPHFTTLDGRTYTFNGLGEYALLREDSKDFEFQGRTELAPNSDATIFSAFAIKDGSDVVEVSANLSTGLLTVRLAGTNISSRLTSVGYNVTTLASIIEQSSDNSFLISFPSGVGITINYTAGLLVYTLEVPLLFEGTTSGLLGNYNNDDSDEFTFRNGTMISNSSSDREIHQFGQSWQITKEESIFTYEAGKSVDTFSNPDHTPPFLDELLTSLMSNSNLTAVCGDNIECLFDFDQTGDVEVGMAALTVANEAATEMLEAFSFPPKIIAPETFLATVGEESVYIFTVSSDSENINVIILHEGEEILPSGIQLNNPVGEHHIITWTPADNTSVLLLTIVAANLNMNNIISFFNPIVQLCACENGGNCTTDGLPVNDFSFVLLNCECPEGYDGEFCQNDADGCDIISCLEGQQCYDYPAPLVGAECSCPDGYATESDSKCIDIDECANVPTIDCTQQCINTPGSYQCDCYDGYRAITANSTQCEDINECEGYNDCHQICINTDGSYYCSCDIGFMLVADSRTCQADFPCTVSSCSQGCANISGSEACFCLPGYRLDMNNVTCSDIDECAEDPCDQSCTNTDGFFTCSCINGYQLDENGRSCNDIDECLSGPCPSDTICNDMDGSYTCDCPDGTMRSRTDCVLIPVVTPSRMFTIPFITPTATPEVEEPTLGSLIAGTIITLLFVAIICAIPCVCLYALIRCCKKCKCRRSSRDYRIPGTVVTNRGLDDIEMHEMALYQIRSFSSESNVLYPDEWEPQNKVVELKHISRHSTEWSKIAQQFHATLPSKKILKIERIQNKQLWVKYYQHCERMKKNNRGEINEQLLFHGTRNNPPNDIYQDEEGFNMNFSSTGMWGNGNYFAVNASYSDAYAHCLPDGTQQMFLAQVLTGRSIELQPDSTLHTPPIIRPAVKGKLRYDTINGYTNGSQVFITYSSDKAYPFYLITYDEKYPDEWEPQNTELELKFITRNSNEWSKVDQKFHATLSRKQIIRIERIQNKQLWKKYNQHCERMKKKNGGMINEKLLFHGTRNTTPSRIYQDEEGFNMRFKSAGMWGKGNYFAVNASYCDDYAYHLPDGTRQMFLAKVLTGRSIELQPDSTLRMPPVVQPGVGNLRYDTVNGCTNGSQVFNTYSSDKAYPFYLITYDEIYPDEWEPQNKLLELKLLDRHSNEWSQVDQNFHATVPKQYIVKIERIQNKRLWGKYKQYCERMKKKNGGVINEKLLFHGTRDTSPKDIYEGEEGFDMRFGSAGMWGNGNYFAVNASYSDNCAYCLPDGTKQMFLAKVLTGRSIKLEPDRTLYRPPIMQPVVGNTRYDTVNGHANGSQVFNTYSSDKAYPFYIITYAEIYPDEWEPQNKDLELRVLDRDSTEWSNVAQRFHATLPSTNIAKIERIQNKRLWEKYYQHCEKMKIKNKGVINEELLFHGTRNNSPNAIYQDVEGFNMKFSSAGMWGNGNYFAVNASYADGYAHRLPDGTQQMFLAKVLTGRSIELQRDRMLHISPIVLDCDTVNGRTCGSQVFITYSSDNAYPFYLITYGEIYPDEWKPQNKELELKLLDRESDEWSKIAQKFLCTLSLKYIVKIERIQNKLLWEKYYQRCEKVKRINDGMINEKLLFHGTGNTPPSDMYQDGNKRFNKAEMLDNKNYFTLNAILSDTNAHHLPDGTKQMFLAKCLTVIGCSSKLPSDSMLHMLPIMQPVVKGNIAHKYMYTKRPQTFTTYSSNNFYPFYLITYTKIYPDEWEPQDKELELKLLDRDSTEWSNVVQQFQANLPLANIVKVHRIQNIQLWVKYYQHCEKMKSKNEGVINEKLLFYGTKNPFHNDIYQSEEGFDMRFSEAGIWGNGIYFGMNASYFVNHAHAYTLSDGTKQIFLAKVLTGHSIELQPDSAIRMPPIIQPAVKENLRYDTINGYDDGTQIYVTYSNDKAYPFYLITYGNHKIHLAADKAEPQSAVYPDEWEPQNEELELKVLVRHCPEWKKVAKQFHDTIPQKYIVKIERIQNKWLWEKYYQHRDRMKRKNDGMINEKLLFHGTRKTLPSSIYEDEEGFDMRFSSAGMWGNGNYFAVNASYSDAYAHRLPDGTQQMFLAKVLTGRSIELHSDNKLRLPPTIKPAVKGNLRYDTVTGQTCGSQVFITYSNDKAYPFYLISYNNT